MKAKSCAIPEPLPRCIECGDTHNSETITRKCSSNKTCEFRRKIPCSFAILPYGKLTCGLSNLEELKLKSVDSKNSRTISHVKTKPKIKFCKFQRTMKTNCATDEASFETLYDTREISRSHAPRPEVRTLIAKAIWGIV